MTRSSIDSSVPYATFFVLFCTPPTSSYRNRFRWSSRTGGRASTKTCFEASCVRMPRDDVKSGSDSGVVRWRSASSMLRTWSGCAAETGQASSAWSDAAGQAHLNVEL